MNIFVLNRGSSSIKCNLYTFQTAPRECVPSIWDAHLKWKGIFEEPVLTIKDAQGKEFTKVLVCKTAVEALEYLLTSLPQTIDAIVHRIVHGGDWFTQSVFITKDVKEKIRLLSELAPLHNLPELEGIEVLERRFPDIPQIATFDTAFHYTLPKYARIYPIPHAWSEEGIRRYGFHGMSFQYCSQRAAELLRCNLNALKMVICHLGSGASLCAIKEGKSIDTTMGFTPLDGLMMDTRSGSIDPGIILYLLKKKTPREISDALYNSSGLLGVSEFSSDMHDIIERNEANDDRAKLALEVYLHRLTALIGSMLVALEGMDVLVFTAGIGENAPLIRKRACEAFSFLDIEIDPVLNQLIEKQDRILSKSTSRVQVLLIHTQEAYEMAKECWKIMSRNNFV